MFDIHTIYTFDIHVCAFSTNNNPQMMRSMWLMVLIFAFISPPARAAFKSDPPCPNPCTCLLFGGTWSVYCNRTGISSIPRGIPISTQLLDISENTIQKIPRDALSYLINLEELDAASNGFHEGSIEPGALDLPKLGSVNLFYNSYTSVPDSLPRNITTLYFGYNQLNTLRADSFANYTALRYVDISNNAMNVIETSALDPLADLNTIYLSFNSLIDASLPPNLFSKNQKVTSIGLRFNKLQNLLQNVPPSVTYFDYVGNQIKTISSYAFRLTPNLQTMEFWEGQVATIEDNAFYGLEQITILDFMQDKISSTLTKDTFNGLTGLKTLYMDLNNISKIEPGAFRSLKSVTSLWFSDNKLSTLDPAVLDTKYTPNLSTLFIDGNPWYCDCHLRWLREKVNNATYVIQDPHLITCAGPSKVAGKAWDVLQPSDFVCP